jgi:enoyl-CoA hydratase
MTITTSIAEETLVVTIDRPPVNALDIDAILALEQAFAAAAHDAPENGVVLTGGGAVFSAGVDTRAFASYSREQRHEMVRAITRMVAQLVAIPVPVVAAVNGHALGGGFVLMLGCDYRIATVSETAKLGLTEAQAGIPFPAGPLEVMRHELGPELLRLMTLTSAVITTQELWEARIIDERCPSEEIKATSIARAKQLAAQSAFRAVKRQIRGALPSALRRWRPPARNRFSPRSAKRLSSRRRLSAARPRPSARSAASSRGCRSRNWCRPLASRQSRPA